MSRAARKRARPVLRGPRRGNAPGLPDEIFFSITQKKAISPNDFASLDQLAGTLLAFADRYNQGARPFNWKFTATDLSRLLDRIGAREDAATKPAEVLQAA